MLRSHTVGSLGITNVGQTISLAGWVTSRRDHGGVIFIDIRDKSGSLQIVFCKNDVIVIAHQLRVEFCISITGIVRIRPKGKENLFLSTGQIEIDARSLIILGESAPLPFQLDETAGIEARLKYRYLDLRRKGPKNAIKLRSKANSIARDILAKYDFIEVETPTLTKSTPEGARDFLVPARLQPGLFYALPQSPQIFKQLLMISGIEKYYQLARCYRDEDFRSDRQPEFTQLDIELSFVSSQDVMFLTEEILKALWTLIDYSIKLPLPKIGYIESISRFGSDKPDLRFGIEITECTKYFKNTKFQIFKTSYIGAVVMPGGASQSRSTLSLWQDFAKQLGYTGLIYLLINNDGVLSGPLSKHLDNVEYFGLLNHIGARSGDCIFFAAGKVKSASSLLGATRIEIAKRLGMIDQSNWAFLWIVNFPMFENIDLDIASQKTGISSPKWSTVHHAFVAPKLESECNFDIDPSKAFSDSYDIVCNGHEIGGGSIRISRRDIQERVFTTIGINRQNASKKFGFLLEAFEFGAPPHGGIALGWDRINALLSGVDSIREVIAFPKSSGGVDPLTNAPTPITKQQRRDSNIDINLHSN